MAGIGIGVNDKRRTRRGRNKEKEPDVTACPMCSNKMEDPMICQNTLVLCPHCNEILLVSENSQRKFLSPISSEISGCTSPKHVPEPEVCTPRQQYDLALKDPHYFHIMLELVSFIKNKPFQVPVIFREKEPNLHRIFVEVTCRGGILKVYRERRLKEVCAALAENLSEQDLYNIYISLLYDLEAWLCNFRPAPPLRPCTSYEKVLVPRLREGQHPPQWIQASAPYTNAAPVNNNRQWTSLPAGFNIGSTGHSNRLSSGACPVPGVIVKGGQPYPTGLTQGFIGQPSEWIDASARFANSAPVNNNQQWTSLPAGFNIGSTGHSNRLSSGPCAVPGVIVKGGQPYPTGLTQPSEWIDASARFANSTPVKNNQQLGSLQQAGVNFGSTYHPNGSSSHLSSAVANSNQVWVRASDYKFNLGLDSEDPAPHPTQGLLGGEASEQGIHDPSHNQRMMVKRKVITESLVLEPMKITRNLSSLPPNR